MSTQKNDLEDLHSLQPSSGNRDETPKQKAVFSLPIHFLFKDAEKENALGCRTEEREILI